MRGHLRGGHSDERTPWGDTLMRGHLGGGGHSDERTPWGGGAL